MNKISITLPILEADIVGKSGYVYPKSVLVKIVEDANEKIKQNGLGILGSFDPPYPESGLGINLSNVTHHVENLRLEGNLLIGDVYPLNSPKGLVLKELINAKTELGLNPRGYGTVSCGAVTDDYQLLAIDVAIKSP